MAKMERTSLTTAVSITVIVFAISIFLHESAHGLAGTLAGGQPLLITSTDLRGDWTNVTLAGYSLIGLSGPILNWLLAFIGLLLLYLHRFQADSFGFFSWLLLAVNGFIAAVYMAVSPLLGIGDWVTIIGRLPASVPLRFVTAAAGAGLALLWFRLARRCLLKCLSTTPHEYVPGIEKLAQISWASGGVLAVLAALGSPLGLVWALTIALGSTLGTTWPLLIAAQHAAEKSDLSPQTSFKIERSYVWIALGTIIGLAFILVLGPGIEI